MDLQTGVALGVSGRGWYTIWLHREASFDTLTELLVLHLA
jgi:hypothetical protein